MLVLGAVSGGIVARMADAALAGLLRDSRALIFPSIYEGFGIPPLEAMQDITFPPVGPGYLDVPRAEPLTDGLGLRIEASLRSHAFAQQALITLHITKKAGVNTHHVLEASFKGLARCLRDEDLVVAVKPTHHQ